MRTARAMLRLPILAAVVGLVVGLLGIGLLSLIWLISHLAFFGELGFHEVHLIDSKLGVWVIAVPTLGGLVIALIARFGSPAIRGHGIPEAMQGVIQNQSRISLRVALLKPLSTAICIGTGGPFGAEGPIIATGGAAGSLIGQWLPNSANERKILLASGAAAGMTAVFGTPLAGVLLAVELLLFEFRARSLLPVAIASGIALGLRGCFHEPFPMLPMDLSYTPGPLMTVGSVFVGIMAGLAGVAITIGLHKIEDLFEKLPCHWTWGPVFGGLFVGVLGWIDPRILGAGYDNLRAMLAGEFNFELLLSLAVLKFLAWSIYLGSGTAGGTLAPIMTIGGAIGSLTVLAIHSVPGFEGFPIAVGALIGMAAIFSSVSRAFLASVAFAFEATHSTASFGPLLLGCACAVLVSRLLMRESIMTERLARNGVRVPEDYEADPLRTQIVANHMRTDLHSVYADTSIQALTNKITQPDSPWANLRLIPIIDPSKELLGVVSRSDVLAAATLAPEVSVLSAATTSPITIHPDATLADAADRMLQHEIGRLPVVSREPRPKLCGILTRKEVLRARALALRAEQRDAPED